MSIEEFLRFVAVMGLGAFCFVANLKSGHLWFSLLTLFGVIASVLFGGFLIYLSM